MFAAATAILAKVGIEGVPSTLATALRTVVVLVLAWAIAFARDEHSVLPNIGTRSFVSLGLSGVATAGSWLAYFRALQLAPASRVAPLDKLSLAFTVLLAGALLKESLGWKVLAGTALMILGALLTAA